MTCEQCHSRVDDYVDGTLAGEDRARIEAHLVECDACRAMAADFREIRRTARALEPRVPPPHVWTRLSAAVASERPRTLWPAWRPHLTGWRPLAAAATLIVLVGGTSWMVLRETSSPAPAARRVATAPPAPADAELAQSVETELKLAEEHYQRAIAGLEQITRTESTALDPQVAAVLQKNLDVIDHAIGESRAALQTQPTSEVAQESLFEALRNKVALLQDTVVLINEMRKGNPEGTARAVSGLNQ
jgi:anti-sigma factor RsiW